MVSTCYKTRYGNLHVETMVPTRYYHKGGFLNVPKQRLLLLVGQSCGEAHWVIVVDQYWRTVAGNRFWTQLQMLLKKGFLDSHDSPFSGYITLL